MYICICNAVTERQVRECAERGVNTLDQLAIDTGLGIGCGRCKEFASDLLEDLQCQREQCQCEQLRHEQRQQESVAETA